MKFTRGLARACMRKSVGFLFDAEVTAIEAGETDGVRVFWHSTTEGETDDRGATLSADAVVICAGVARGLAALVGDRLPIYPVKGYSIRSIWEGRQVGSPRLG